MCFVHDYDWTAEVQEITDGHAKEATKCHECHSVILIGEWFRNIYQQEHEDVECYECDGTGKYCYSVNISYPPTDNLVDCEYCCGTGERGEGLSNDFNLCGNCCKLLQAIKVVELAAGCSESESQPALTELYDAMIEDKHEGYRYREMALAMFPELAEYMVKHYGEVDDT